MGLPKRFSNKRPALKSLISRVLKGSERRGPRNRTPKRHDSRGAVAKNPAKSQTRLTTEQRVNLLADYEAGIPVRAIAAKYGVHRGTIPKFVLGSGGTLRTPGLDEAGRVRATALYADGLTLKEVAEKLGVDDKRFAMPWSRKVAGCVRAVVGRLTRTRSRTKSRTAT